ncbi:hypothetical protein CcaverHIS002_0104750 [Cutaneotrichosporon cavernicola]|nr:hypothetical protein CcaverHIS002_0104750 [Cutaneotrichosporon cavernicola]BEJ03299.1 hypothetical protein CcaverHIS641_0104740 [Cutaneotrichosporon cavernicola]
MIENQYDIAIIGASIVGASLASRLAPHIRVLLIDNHVSEPDPFVQLKPPLTELARRSVAAYSSIPGAFDQTGSLEVARTDSEMEDLRGRGILSVNMGLDVTLRSWTKCQAASTLPMTA